MWFTYSGINLELIDFFLDGNFNSDAGMKLVLYLL